METKERWGIKTGYPIFDAKLGEFKSGGAYILAAEDKAGKTTLILNWAKNFMTKGFKVLYLTTEGEESDALDTLNKLYKTTLWNKEKFIVKNGTRSLTQDAQLVREVLKSGVGIFIIDNLTPYGLLASGKKAGWEMIGDAGTIYHNLAEEYNAVGFTILHLTNGTKLNEVPLKIRDMLKTGQGEKVFDDSVSVYRRPSRDDIRGGGVFRSQTFGQILLWRPFQSFDSKYLNQKAMIIIENHRYGGPGQVRFTFDGEIKTFIEDEIDASEKWNQIQNNQYKEDE